MEQKNYWFKRRRFGWGYTPVTWQGWTAVALFVGFVVYRSTQLSPDPASDEWFWHWFSIAAAAFALMAISFAKGPTPKWRWGKRPDDDPAEDI